MAYSNKALPSGTVLREWRLEEVLGVGGFGIVYKGRGIYFDELVAIKEYFPSAISDRKDGDTVVPIDSDAEEVHALGLKRFVEEAKLLWNLSTPSRHPNIVSVRSLFEIHGTAYMVMDFEDGLSLSKLLKQGRRFNEASLLALMTPIAEGLDRAHRVGVLHRDIKPANILVNADGRPVLIDFGSARFESGDATSTKVTFHTPPYAAIEQYVKTYEQGPWTDVYALGVVLYECITGGKPPEVLERLHGGDEAPLAERECPGYSRKFLRAVDAAMTIRPGDRPQSIAEWLALFSAEDEAAQGADDGADEATRFVAFDTLTHNFIPVAALPPGFDRIEGIETGVPETVDEAEFKRPGEISVARPTMAEDPAPVDLAAKPAADHAADHAADTAADPAAVRPEPARAPSGDDAGAAAAAPGSGQGKHASRRPLIMGGLAALVAAGVAGGIWLSGQTPGGKEQVADGSSQGAATVGAAAPAASLAAPGGLAADLQALVAEASQGNAPAAAVQALAAVVTRLAAMPPAAASGPEAGGAVIQGSRDFAAALRSDAERRARQLAAKQPWADPRRAGAASGQGADQVRMQAQLVQARVALGSAAASLGGTTDPAAAIGGARQVLARWQAFAGLQFRASRMAGPSGSPSAQPSMPAETVSAEPLPEPAKAAAGKGAPAGKAAELAGVIAECERIANQVIAAGRSARPGSGSEKDRQNARVLEQNVTTARNYVAYLRTLSSAMRGAKDAREADRLISQADQTKRYLLVLLSRSTTASH